MEFAVTVLTVPTDWGFLSNSFNTGMKPISGSLRMLASWFGVKSYVRWRTIWIHIFIGSINVWHSPIKKYFESIHICLFLHRTYDINNNFKNVLKNIPLMITKSYFILKRNCFFVLWSRASAPIAAVAAAWESNLLTERNNCFSRSICM